MDLHILYIIFGIVSPQLPQAANPSKHTVYLHIEPKLNSILDLNLRFQLILVIRFNSEQYFNIKSKYNWLSYTFTKISMNFYTGQQ
jgi:hypothetical protein